MTVLIEDNEIVVPGEHLAIGDYKTKGGILQDGEKFYSSMVGVFTVRDNKLRVRPLKSRYQPAVGDRIIGYIEDANLTSWTVNIRGAYTGLLLASKAVKGRFDPIKDDTRRIFDVGDVIKAEIVSFDRTRDPMLTTNHPRLGKLDVGRIMEVSPNHIPRIIGRRGSMVGMIKNKTDTKIFVAQNGRIWIKGQNRESENKVIEAINQITREAHVSGLTDRIETLLDNQEN